jgi:hypothetical protein
MDEHIWMREGCVPKWMNIYDEGGCVWMNISG